MSVRVPSTSPAVLALALVLAACGDDGTATDPDAPVRFPLTSWRVQQDFGVWNGGWGGFHLAEDILVAGGAPVFSMAEGVVGVALEYPDVTGYGAVLLVEHPIGGEEYVSLYGHLSSLDEEAIQVAAGETVGKGQLLGFTRHVSEPDMSPPEHLHFGIRTGPFDLEARICGVWLYVGYTRECPGMTHEEHRALWVDPSEFLEELGAGRP